MNISTYGYVVVTPTAVGLLKITTTTLHHHISEFRRRTNYFAPLTFRTVRDHNLKLHKQLIDTYFSVPHTCFAAYIGASPATVGAIIARSLEKNENMVVLCEQNLPEAQIKQVVKKKMRRDALFGIHPLSRRESSGLQMAQVLLGIVSYALSLLNKDVIAKNAKFKLVKHLQRHLNTDKLARTNEYYLRFKRRFSVEL